MGTRGSARNLTRKQVDMMARPIVKALLNDERVQNAFLLGSYRRKTYGINDLDILVLSDKHEDWPDILQRATSTDGVATIDAVGTKTARVIMDNGLQIDLMMTDSPSLGAAMLHFTGSKEFNIRCRAAAKEHEYTLNDKGLWKGPQRVPNTDTEEKILNEIGIGWTEPEHR